MCQKQPLPKRKVGLDDEVGGGSRKRRRRWERRGNIYDEERRAVQRGGEVNLYVRYE